MPDGPQDERDHEREQREAVAVVGIQRLQGAYADIVNRRAFGELADLFTDGCPVTVDTRTRDPIHLAGGAAVGAFIAGAVERFDFFEFVILSTRIHLDGPDTAWGRLYLCEIRQDAATGVRSEAFGVYHDRYRHVGGWRFAERRYHSLARTATGPRDLDTFPFPAPATDGR